MPIKRTIGAMIAVAGLVGTPATAQKPRESPVEAKYVPPSFAAALVFEPAKLDKAMKNTGLPVAEFWKVIVGIAGTDAKPFERVTFFIEPFPGGNVAFMPAFALRYPAGTDARKQLAPLLGGEVTNAKVGEVAYVRSAKYKLAKVEMAGYSIDDRTLLVAAWPTLEPMLKAKLAKDSDRVLATELAKADLTHDLTLVVTPAAVMKRITEIEKQSGKPTEEPLFKEIKPLLENVRVLTVAVNFGSEALVRARFRCAAPADAVVVHDTLKGLLAKAKKDYPATRKDLEKQFPPELAKPLVELLDSTTNDHKLEMDGRSGVLLTIARPKDWTPKK